MLRQAFHLHEKLKIDPMYMGTCVVKSCPTIGHKRMLDAIKNKPTANQKNANFRILTVTQIHYIGFAHPMNPGAYSGSQLQCVCSELTSLNNKYEGSFAIRERF